MSSNTVKNNGCMLDEILIEYQNNLGITIIDINWKFGLSLNNLIMNFNNQSMASTLNVDNFLCLSAGFLFSNNNNIDLSLTDFVNNWVFNIELASSSLKISESLYFDVKHNNNINWNLRNLSFSNHKGFWRNNITTNFINPNFNSFNLANQFTLGGHNSIIHFNLISDSFIGVINLNYLNIFNNSFYANGKLVSST